jgi:multiple sugar transport system permease protein
MTTPFFHRWRKFPWPWALGIVVMLIIVSLPVFIMFKYSISDRASIISGGGTIPLWPYHPSFRIYRYILGYRDFYAAVFVSLKIALLTIGIAMVLGVPAAYVLARTRIPGKALLLIMIISVRLFPDICSIIPVMEVFIKLRLDNSYLGASLAHSLLALPYVIYIARGVFEAIPPDLEQQAQVLGATKIQSFIQVVLPLAIPGLAAAAIYTFLLSWDEFIFSYFLLGFGKLQTLTLYLKHKMAFAPPQNFLMTISVFLSLPVIIFTLLVQNYMKADITSGAVK